MPDPYASSSGSSPRIAGAESRTPDADFWPRLLRAVLFCFCSVFLASDSGATNVLTDGPSGPDSRIHGFEIGAGFSLPLPMIDANRDVAGMSARLSFTVQSERTTGVGVDVGYHYWPVSAGFKQRFDDHLDEFIFNPLRTGDGTWGMQVSHLGAHVRGAPLESGGWRPWFRVGAGLYQVDPNISGYTGDAGFFWVVAPPLKRTSHFGGSLAAGADLPGARAIRIGVDANYHFVNCDEDYGSNLQILTVGLTATSGWARPARGATAQP